MDRERHKQSEKRVGEKAKEWANADSDLTFAEWCYRQGEKDERAKTINEFLERVLSDKYDCEHCPPSEVYCYKCVARRVAEQMKEQKNENK